MSEERPKAARTVAPGESWLFKEHRTLAESDAKTGAGCPWDRPAMVAAIGESRGAGLSFGEIGRRLGVSKNTAIGIAARNGMIKPTPKPTPPEMFPAGGCLWSFGEVGAPEFHFCGRPVARPGEAWCAEHRRRVYVAAGARARAEGDESDD